MTVHADTPNSLTLLRGAGCVAVCLLLAGCPSASNPTQAPATPAPSMPPSSSSSSGSQGSPSSPAAPEPSTPSAPAPSSASSASSPASRSAESAPGSPAPAAGSPTADAGAQAAGSGSTEQMPGGAANDGSAASDGAGADDAESPAEPGFGDMAGTDALPDMRDTPTLDPGTMAALEAAMEAAAAGEGSPAGTSGGGGAGNEAGMEGAASGTGTASGADGAAGAGILGRWPLTPAEQVAILDARLESGAGDFDSMILEEQAKQRSARRESTDNSNTETAGGGAPSGGDGPFREDITVASATGGQGGVNTPGRSAPTNPARYPPPTDIPSGNDDDVVARQLREAAMREPDPAVREKLWDEYRKYKGIAP